MYQIGTYVVYGIQGVCRVVGTETQRVNRVRTEFLVLEPLDKHEAKFYLPTGNPSALAKLKSVLTPKEATQLLESAGDDGGCWIPEESRRKQRYRELTSSGDRIALMQMLSALHRYRQVQLDEGRKFHQCDDNFLRDAERILCVEIALVLNMTFEAARADLRQRING